MDAIEDQEAIKHILPRFDVVNCLCDCPRSAITVGSSIPQANDTFNTALEVRYILGDQMTSVKALEYVVNSVLIPGERSKVYEKSICLLPIYSLVIS